MSLFLTILIVLAVIILSLEIRRRIRKASGRLGRARNAQSSRSGGFSQFSHERPSLRGGGRKKTNRLAPLAGPVGLGMVFILMGAWLISSYLMPDAETTAAVPVEETFGTPKPDNQTKVLGGRIIIGGDAGAFQGGETMSQGAASVLNSSPALATQEQAVAQAAKAMINGSSRLDQVGLLPGQVKPSTAAASSQNALTKPSPKASSGQQAADLRQPKPAQTGAKTAAPKAASGAPSLVGAASGATLATTASRPVTPTSENLLGGGRDFTVHLGSFRERSNAEDYLSKLGAAGEQGFISETMVNGQHWYRVMSGRFSERSDAEIYGRDLKKRGLTADAGQYMIKYIAAND